MFRQCGAELCVNLGSLQQKTLPFSLPERELDQTSDVHTRRGRGQLRVSMSALRATSLAVSNVQNLQQLVYAAGTLCAKCKKMQVPLEA